MQLHVRPSRSSSPNPSPNTSISQRRLRDASSEIQSFAARPSESDQVPALEPITEPQLPEPELPIISGNVVKSPSQKIAIPGTEKRIVVFLTSLRVVRSTFSDCRTVLSILRGFRVNIDERDLSMDSLFLSELQRILGHYQTSKLTLPRVFIGGRYIGGVDEVVMLHETGELKKILQGLPAAAPGVCEVCGGYRFILCNECDGSHKYYTEECEGGDGGFTICTSCNENGLLRCPSCNLEPLVPI